jgi:carboxypeptidase family protein/TonB-dependent receptor-like protein
MCSSVVRSLWLGLFFLLSYGAVPAAAQFDTAAVVGTVHDSSGAVVPDAKVTLTNIATGVSQVRTTTASGNYEFNAVRPGDYIVTAEKPGFAIALMDNVQVQVAARLRVDLQMPVGQISERVVVTAVSPLIQTDSSQRGQVITTTQIQELPLNGREYSSLALLTTGVRQSALNRSTNSTPREGAFNVNALRSTFNNFMIDGVDNNAYGTSNQGFSNQVMQPPPDAIREFQVVTNNESAEYGRSAGATVNVAYKSGSNQLHGSAWEFNRNTALNAVGYFKPAAGKPTMQRNQFGGVLGGPIVKNKAFFFGDYEGFRQERGVPAFNTIPDAVQRTGILTVDVRDPRTGTLYPAGSRLPMTAFAAKVLAGLPPPNVAGVANNYSVVQNLTNHSNKAAAKIDLQPSASINMFGRYGWRRLETVDQPVLPLPSGGDGNGTIYARNKQLALGSTYTPSDRSLLEVRFGWSAVQGGKNPPALGSTAAADEYGLPGLPSDPRIAGGLPSQLITGYSNLGRQATNPQWQYPTVWNPKLNYTWLAGTQSFKAGYEYQNVAVEVQDVNPLYGRDTYAGNFSRPAGITATNPQYTLADFMFGARSQYAISNVLVANLRKDMHFAYLQDDIRVNDALTLNLGVRYEYATPFWEENNVLSNYDPGARTMLRANDGSLYDRALVDPDKNNFAPRLGFAWSVMPQTVLRGGYGISYVHINRTGAADVLPINGPQVINAVVNQTNAADPSFLPTERGYPAGLADPQRFNPLLANISFIPRDFQAGRVQSWFVSGQREFGPRMLVDVAYVGNKGDNLLLIGNLNQAAVNNAAGTIPLQSRRPIATFSDITYVFNGGLTRYDALQTKFEWRMGSDILLLNSLTVSKAKDNGAQSLENNNGNFPGPQDINNLAAEYQTGAYHQPYNNTTSFVWSLPFGRGKRWGSNMSAAMDILAGGWQVAGINTFVPGEAVTFTYAPAAAFQVSGIAQDFRGANNYRPNVTCDPYAPDGQQSITNWFNRDCVVIPTDPSQPFGNAGRNTVRGPRYWTFDLAATKQVRVTDSSRIELRIEAFNLFDRANFTAPNGIRTNAAFGTITSTYDPRQMQLGLKVIW